MKKVTIFFAILSVAILIYGIVTTKEIRKTFEINDNTGLIIDNLNGPVKITGWDKDFVDVLVRGKTLSEWSDILNIQRGTLAQRLYVYGWNEDDVLSKPLYYKYKKHEQSTRKTA